MHRWLIAQDHRTLLEGTVDATVQTRQTVGEFVSAKFDCPSHLSVFVFGTRDRLEEVLTFSDPRSDIEKADRIVGPGNRMVLTSELVTNRSTRNSPSLARSRIYSPWIWISDPGIKCY